MENKRIHFEPFLYLPALSHDAAIVAWGGFYFEIEEEHGEEEWKLLDDDEVRKRLGRNNVIGENSEPYAPNGRIEITEMRSGQITSVHIRGANHAVVHGLDPETEYQSCVVLREPNGQAKEWDAGPSSEWVLAGGRSLRRI